MTQTRVYNVMLFYLSLSKLICAQKLGTYCELIIMEVTLIEFYDALQYDVL